MQAELPTTSHYQVSQSPPVSFLPYSISRCYCCRTIVGNLHALESSVFVVLRAMALQTLHSYGAWNMTMIILTIVTILVTICGYINSALACNIGLSVNSASSFKDSKSECF